MNRNITVPSYPLELRPSNISLKLFLMGVDDLCEALHTTKPTARALLKEPERLRVGQLARILSESPRNPEEILAELFGLEELKQ